MRPVALNAFIALCSAAAVNGFAPSLQLQVQSPFSKAFVDSNKSLKSSGIIGLNMADVASEVEAAPAVELPKPAMMDEGIFKFNKILIDTVYDIICFFYPVKGTERDFARFYVLETVARVPYFAYLSVMHLR